MFRTLAALMLMAAPALADWRDEVIYFVMIDRFADGDSGNNGNVDLANPLAFQGGDLKGLTAQLNEIASLGATAIWITPVNGQVDHPIDAPEGTFYPHHGYWADDFSAVDQRFGSIDDLKALVDAAHEKDLKVILDVVFNHAGFDAKLVTDHPDWFRIGEDCGGDELTTCLSGLPDLREDVPEARNYVIDAQIALAKQSGVDGFRLDTVKHLPHEVWTEIRARTRAELSEDFFLLGEVWDADKISAEPYFEGDEMDALFDFSFRDRVLKFLTNVESPERLGKYFTNRHKVAEGHVMAPFLSNHDMPMLLAMLRGDTQKLKIALTLLLTAEGPPVIAWGEEVGRQGGPWPDNREVMPWGERDVLPGQGKPRDEDLRAMVKELLDIRADFPELRSAETDVIWSTKDALVFARGVELVIAVNRGDTDLKMDEGWTLQFAFDDAPENILPAKSARIYTRTGP
jgi:glycosidase